MNAHVISSAPPDVEAVSGFYIMRQDGFVPSKTFRENRQGTSNMSTGGGGAPE